MVHHKFAVGQEVEVLPGRKDPRVQPGIYRIVRQLPAEGGDWQYRVVNTHDGQERVMHEKQLAARLDPWSSLGGAKPPLDER